MTNTEIQKLLDEGVANLKQTTVGYVNKHWQPPPPAGSKWKLGLDKIAAARAALNPAPPDPGPTEPPVPPPTTVDALELNGTFTIFEFRDAIKAGTKAIRPTSNGQIRVRFTDKWDRWLPSNIQYERITFDGEGYCPGIWLPGMTNFKFLGSTFKNFFEDGVADSHSEALYIGGGCHDGLIDQCVFDNNGTTSHIFFTSFTHLPAGTPHPYNICIKRTKFTRCHNQWYSIQMHNDVIPDGATNKINIDPSCTHDGPGFQMWVRPC